MPSKTVSRLRRKYGISAADYEAMLRKQDDRCQICRRPSLDDKRLAVDHNHVTGAVRGLLCSNCNSGIALLGDDHKRLLRAAAYVAGVLSLP